MEEKNRNTLLRAIRELPVHTPPDLIWEAVSMDLDRIESEVPLRNAIRDLPDHEPPAEVWENIAIAIETPSSEHVLHQAISELPEYDPPAMVWEVIEKELVNDLAVESNEQPIRRIVPIWKRPAIAASFTALFCAMAWLFFSPSGDGVSMAYTTIQVNKLVVDDGIERDEMAFELVLNELNQKMAQTNDPYLEDLKKELEDLNLAKRQVEEVMGKYGQDEALIAQITTIEHERTAILKEMVTKI